MFECAHSVSGWTNQANKRMQMLNAVLLVWGSLRLAPVRPQWTPSILDTLRHIQISPHFRCNFGMFKSVLNAEVPHFKCLK